MISESKFWRSTPRKMVGLIAKYNEMEIEKMKLMGHFARGGTIEEKVSKKTIEKETYDPFN